jgi:hypothetical protein
MRKLCTMDNAARSGVAALALFVVYLFALVAQCETATAGDGAAALDDAGATPAARAILTLSALGAGGCVVLAASRWRRGVRKRRRMESTLAALWVRRNAGDHAGAGELLAEYKRLAAGAA